jgi:hypothetical protein
MGLRGIRNPIVGTERITGMRTHLLGIALAVFVGACGGSDGGPAAPPPAATDLTGRWSEANGGSVSWTLTQTGTTVAGTSSYSENNGRYLGAISGDGIVSGSINGRQLTFTDTYATVSKPNCSVQVTGTLSIDGQTMSGRYTETDSCNGAVLGTINGTIAFRKR